MIETLEKKYNKGAADVAPAIATKNADLLSFKFE